MDDVLKNCIGSNVKILREKYSVKNNDQNSNHEQHTHAALIESCVDGLVHSIYERNIFADVQSMAANVGGGCQPKYITHFDHLAMAVHRHTSADLIRYFEAVFGAGRFFVNKLDRPDTGFAVQTGKTGMHLKALGFDGDSNREEATLKATPKAAKPSTVLCSGFKVVSAEPFDYTEKNQIRTYLEEHDGPGIQHIGLHVSDIRGVVAMTRTTSNSAVKYYEPPREYYESQTKLDEIASLGLDEKSLRENHILLDGNHLDNKNEVKMRQSGGEKNYLMQVFTQPIFEKETFFLEFIQRVGQASGFGAANIKALWDAVQLTLFKFIK